jgi:1-acyl-sn-glycerol-3-phosphate acyltransferase
LNFLSPRTTHWKTGFHDIALKADVPIVLAYMDYARKVSGLGPVFTPTGNVEADMAEIKGFHAGIQGRRPQHFDVG